MPERDEYAPGTPSWVDLSSADMDQSKAFYRGLFGWEGVADDNPDAGGYTMFLKNGKPVAGMGPQQDPNIPPSWTTYVTVTDADETAQKVKDAGGMVFLEPMDVLDVGRMAMFADPTGAVFAVWQPRAHKGAALVNEDGTLCWNELATRDADTAKKFYAAAIGWGEETNPMGDGQGSYTEWKLGGESVGGMMEMDENWPAEIPPHWMTYFATDDCDATVKKAEELGGTISVPPTDIPVGRFSAIADPQGAIFSVIQMNEPAS